MFFRIPDASCFMTPIVYPIGAADPFRTGMIAGIIETRVPLATYAGDHNIVGSFPQAFSFHLFS
jgi:hypothetical protein